MCSLWSLWLGESHDKLSSVIVRSTRFGRDSGSKICLRTPAEPKLIASLSMVSPTLARIVAVAWSILFQRFFLSRYAFCALLDRMSSFVRLSSDLPSDGLLLGLGSDGGVLDDFFFSLQMKSCRTFRAMAGVYSISSANAKIWSWPCKQIDCSFTVCDASRTYRDTWDRERPMKPLSVHANVKIYREISNGILSIMDRYQVAVTETELYLISLRTGC